MLISRRPHGIEIVSSCMGHDQSERGKPIGWSEGRGVICALCLSKPLDAQSNFVINSLVGLVFLNSEDPSAV